MTTEDPIVSVIVPTHNSARTLETCLHSIRTQTHKSIELVVVDNRSSDRTIAIASRYADVTLSTGPERSAQRNFGAGRARGGYLLFIDSDMDLESSVISECLDAARRYDAVAVIIPEVSVGEGYWTKCRALERSCYPGDESIEVPRFVERGIFDSLRGFDEQLTGVEDWDFAERLRRAGQTIARIHGLISHDEGHLTLREAMRKKYYYGRTMLPYLRSHPAVALHQLPLLRAAYVRHWDVLARRPLLAAGMVFMKGCEMLAGGAGLIVGNARQRSCRPSCLRA